MKLNVDNTTYLVDFEYSGPVTICYLNTLDGKRVAAARTQRAIGDKHVKETARKISLRRALAKTDFTRNERRKFWTEFHRLRGKTHYLKHAGVAV